MYWQIFLPPLQKELPFRCWFNWRAFYQAKLLVRSLLVCWKVLWRSICNGTNRIRIPTKRYREYKKTVYHCFSGGVLPSMFRSQKKINTPVDRKLCVKTGDNSYTKFNWTGLRFVLALPWIKFWTDLCLIFCVCLSVAAHSVTLVNLLNAECRMQKSTLLNLLIWPSLRL